MISNNFTDNDNVSSTSNVQAPTIVSEQDRYGNTPLHIASSVHDAKILLQNGANINLKNNAGCTPLHMAATSGNVELVEYLISQGASLEEYNEKGWSSFHFATRNGRVGVSKFLIDIGVDINEKTGDDDWSPLQFACFNGFYELAEILIDKGEFQDTVYTCIYCISFCFQI